ncbi:transcription termination/antitermination protein NusG [Methylovirgula sp. HY1]|uniref:transcription termination/antitermination protein NusG n=1 Tax=Methylovirgula sp. HY1 TaxID=2822761 RepID=UPI001C5AD215|nr:transcription termination/antitermination NusG family protein [Methylovirgula sp. HY1]QXX74252.1 Transcription termination/antitermination protein NusG [Methylovirgula sp. HY1]
MKDWYLIYTAPNGEWAAADGLVRRGFDVFVPTVLWKRRVRGKTIAHRSCLFPSYLFVAQSAREGRFVEIEEAPCVLTLVKSDGGPIALPEVMVSGIASAIGDDCFRYDERRDVLRYVERGAPKEDLSRFRAGEMVRVMRGPFEGVLACIAAAPTRERIAVLLGVFAGERYAELPVSFVEVLT